MPVSLIRTLSTNLFSDLCERTHSTGLHSRSGGHRVSKQTVARHGETHYACYARTCNTPQIQSQVSPVEEQNIWCTYGSSVSGWMSIESRRTRLKLHFLLTCVESYSYSDRNVWHVPHFEGSHSAEDVQRHVGNFCSMAVAVGDGNTRRHHVGIADSLHLEKAVRKWAPISTT